jgi:hypothetical protein
MARKKNMWSDEHLNFLIETLPAKLFDARLFTGRSEFQHSQLINLSSHSNRSQIDSSNSVILPCSVRCFDLCRCSSILVDGQWVYQVVFLVLPLIKYFTLNHELIQTVIITCIFSASALWHNTLFEFNCPPFALGNSGKAMLKCKRTSTKNRVSRRLQRRGGSRNMVDRSDRNNNQIEAVWSTEAIVLPNDANMMRNPFPDKIWAGLKRHMTKESNV